MICKCYANGWCGSGIPDCGSGDLDSYRSIIRGGFYRIAQEVRKDLSQLRRESLKDRRSIPLFDDLDSLGNIAEISSSAVQLLAAPQCWLDSQAAEGFKLGRLLLSISNGGKVGGSLERNAQEHGVRP
jgi:hypothetical protein